MDSKIAAPKEWLREIEVEIEPERLTRKLESLLDTYRARAEIPGFRKGKVPLPVLKRRLGSALESAAVEEIVEQTSAEVLEQHQLKPAARAKLTDLEVTPDKAIRYKLRLEVLPEFELMDYHGLKLRKQEPTGFDQEFERRLKELQNQCATFRPLDRLAQEHDFVTVDYQTLEADRIIAKPKTNMLVEVGDPQNFDEVNRTLAGVSAGDERSVDIELPNDHPEKDLAGRKVTFRFKVREVKEKVLPEVNEEFATDLGFENLDGLRKEINEAIMADRAKLVENGLKNQVFNFLVSQHEFEPPESWVKARYERLRYEYRLPDDEETRKRLVAVAARRAKFDIIATRIAKQEGIEVTEQEVQEEIERLAQGTRKPAEEFGALLDNPGFRNQIMRDKVMSLILEKADVS